MEQTCVRQSKRPPGGVRKARQHSEVFTKCDQWTDGTLTCFVGVEIKEQYGTMIGIF